MYSKGAFSLFSKGVRMFSTQATKAITENLAKKPIVWKETSDAFHPYTTKIEDEVLHLRINDFPEEPLYSVMHKDQPIMHTNGFPSNWTRPEVHAAEKPTGPK